MTQTTQKLRIGVAGIGRMGKRHASNVAYYTPRAELVAVAEPDESQHAWAKKELPASTRIYTSTEEMLDDPNVDALLIATSTDKHPELVLKAIKKGKHVLTEKPISISLEESVPVVEAARNSPELKVMIGFSRRYDDSYRDVYNKIQSGLLGRPYYIRSATNDMFDESGFFVKYSAASGGIFLDVGIHDIDIARWLLDVANPENLKNPQKQVTSVYATGLNVHHPDLAQTGDCDNGFTIIEFENGTKCIVHLSRTATNGHDAPCEVFGSKAKITTRNEIRDEHGVRTESHQNYYDRFQGGFLQEVSTFSACVLDDKPVPTTLADGYAAAEIAAAATHSFRTGKTVFFDDNGAPILS